MPDPRLDACEADLARLGYRSPCASAYLRMDLTGCEPEPTVRAVGDGAYELSWGCPAGLLPVATMRITLTAAQVAAITKLAKGG